MVDLGLNILAITLNANGLNTPTKSHISRVGKQYGDYKKIISNIMV